MKELLTAQQRASDAVAPFSALVESTAATHAARTQMTHASRQALDELTQEAQALMR